MENRIAEQIHFYRKQKGLTQEQLAEAMGVSVAAVSKWEQGQSLPEIPMLMELADFFDLSVDALLGYRLRANDRKSIVERMKCLRREDNYDEGIAEAEKALQKFPNTFSVVYECSKLFEMAGLKRQDKKMQSRSLDLLSHAIRLLSQNSDPEISEMSLRLDMANVLLDMEDWERALALFKENNACGLLDDQKTYNQSEVPGLGSIPVLGWLFKSRNKKSTQTNLFIFIAPKVIRNAADSADLTREKQLVLHETSVGHDGLGLPIMSKPKLLKPVFVN